MREGSSKRKHQERTLREKRVYYDSEDYGKFGYGQLSDFEQAGPRVKFSRYN